MFIKHYPPPPPARSGRWKCRNVPECFARALWFCEAQCSSVRMLAFGVALLLHGGLLLEGGGGGLWRFELCMKKMEKREPALGPPSRGGGGCKRTPTPPLATHPQVNFSGAHYYFYPNNTIGHRPMTDFGQHLCTIVLRQPGFNRT